MTVTREELLFVHTLGVSRCVRCGRNIVPDALMFQCGYEKWHYDCPDVLDGRTDTPLVRLEMVRAYLDTHPRAFPNAEEQLGEFMLWREASKRDALRRELGVRRQETHD